MSYITREGARKIACPACDAKPGEKCIGARRKVRESVHAERLIAAAEAGQRPVVTASADNVVLRDVDGNVVGRVVGLEIDVDPVAAFGRGEGAGGTYGGGSRSGAAVAGQSEASPKDEGVQGGQTTLLPGAEPENKMSEQVAEVWAHYQEVVPGGKRRVLDARRRRVIERGLSVRTVEQCKLACNGLAQSPFHNGDNDRKTKYLDIEYALGQKSESPDARIDKWLDSVGATGDLSPIQTKLMTFSEATRRQMSERMTRVRRAIGSQHEPTRRAGAESLSVLKEHGIDVIITPDQKFGGWVVTK